MNLSSVYVPWRLRHSVALAFALVLWLLPSQVHGHLLGNYTVNRYSRIELEANIVRVYYVLDIAEIPSVQDLLIAGIDSDAPAGGPLWDAYSRGKVAEVLDGLTLVIAGKATPLNVVRSSVSRSTGQANLPILRVEIDLAGPWSGDGNEFQGAFVDTYGAERYGWREIVVRAGPGLRLVRSSVSSEDTSDELRTYPESMLQTPLDTRRADWTFAIGGDGSAPRVPVVPDSALVARPIDGFTSLIAVADLTPSTILLALLSAMFLGGVHAASPGHGKAIMAAYIVGTRGTATDAVLLAGTVAASHTVGVLALGIVTISLSNVILPEQLYPWLTLVSGVIVLVIGLSLLVTAVRRHFRRRPAPHQHTILFATDEESSGHRHDLPVTWRSLLGLGVTGGIIPSASALVVLLGSIALGRLGFGLVLIIAFGLGMGVVLTAAGLLLVNAGRMTTRIVSAGSRHGIIIARAVPMVSAVIMATLGVVATVQALQQFGVVRF